MASGYRTDVRRSSLPPVVAVGAGDPKPFHPGDQILLGYGTPFRRFLIEFVPRTLSIARYVISRIPFDRDAITLTPPEARRLLGDGGFQVLRTDFLFIFPRWLGWLRRLEPGLTGWPLGAQYLVLGRKVSVR